MHEELSQDKRSIETRHAGEVHLWNSYRMIVNGFKQLMSEERASE